MGTIKLKQTKQEVQAQVVEQNVTVNSTVAEAPVTRERGVLKEFTERADSYSRHFELNNNTRKSVYSASPVSYYDEAEHKWKAIDNTLTEKTDCFESNCGSCKTEIFKPAQGKKVRMTVGAGCLSWDYLGREPSSDQTAVQNQAAAIAVMSVPTAGQTAETVLKVEAGKEGNLQSKESRAVYENADPKADLEYLVQGNNLKENIIVKEPAESYRFVFSMALQGLKLRLSEDNSRIVLYAESTDAAGQKVEKVEAFIPTPFMTDSNGVNSEEVYFEVEEAEGDTCRFVVVADADWMNAPERTFPVTIDPQIVTMDSSFITTQLQRRPINCGSGSGSTSQAWSDAGTDPGIKVIRNSSSETRTRLTIQKSEFVWDYPVSKANLRLKADPAQTNSGLIAVKVKYSQQADSAYSLLKTVSINSSTTLSIDLTDQLRNHSGDDIDVCLEPAGTVNTVFYHSGVNAPVLEVEYLTGEKTGPIKKEFVLAGGMLLNFHVTTSEWTASFTDVPSSDSLLGVGISHVFKLSEEDHHVGDDFRLNLDETLVKNGTGSETQYVYTDAAGDKHAFKENYYYVNDNGVRQKISSKTSIVANTDGTLSYTTGGRTYEAHVDYRTTSGLTIAPRLEGYKNVELLEQRIDEQKQAEEQLEAYRKNLESFVYVDKEDGAPSCRLEYYLDSLDSLELFINHAKSGYLVMTEGEVGGYQSTLFELWNLTDQLNDLDSQIEELEGKSNTGGLSQEESSNLQDLQKQRTTLQRQKEVIEDTQYGTLKIKEDTSETYLETIEKYYKEYVNLKEQVAQMKRQLPVNYLTDGKIYKGFNEEGRLVAVYDRYDNMLSLEYDKDGESTGKLLRVYDGDSKQIVFDYRPNGLLDSITDTRGRRISYDYTDSKLTKVYFADGRILNLEYFANDGLKAAESSDHERAELAQTSDGWTVTWKSDLTAIRHGEPVRNTEENGSAIWAQVAKVTISYMETTASGGLHSTSLATITNENGEKVYYRSDVDGNVSEYYEETDGKITKAVRYEINFYASEKVLYANEESLYKKDFSSFTASDFTGGDWEEVTLNEYNLPSKKETNAQKLSDNTTQKTVTLYQYDADQRCVQETTTVTIQKNGSTINTFDQITKYSYNAAGAVTRKESWVDGEEFTNGKTVEETEFDENGNPVRSFTYNSLDPSSKFYTESEYAENGQVTADYDESGEHKTEYEYIPGTNVVRTQKLPNGSKFSYGHDQNDQVTAITQSTEEGEENSNQTVYTCGLATEHRSGNNVVHYEYDNKKRLTKIRFEGFYWPGISLVGSLPPNYLERTYEEDVDGNEVINNCYIPREDDRISDQIQMTRNKHGDLVSVKYYQGSQNPFLDDKINEVTYSYTYDDRNRLSEIKKEETILQSYTYDDLDRQTKHVFGNNSHETLYNDYGQVRLDRFKYDNATVTSSYVYTYKDDSSRSLIGMSVGNIEESYESDFLGRNKEIIQTLNYKTYGKRYGYYKNGDHATNRVNAISYTRDGQTDGKVMYTYDSMGNVISVNVNGKQVEKFSYDKLGRLIFEENLDKNRKICYTYDENGNILTKSVNGEVTVYKYRPKTNFLMAFGDETFAYDGMGNPTTYRGMDCTWVRGRCLNSVSVGGKKAYYGYDESGLRKTKKIYAQSTADEPDETIQFVYENDKLLRQKNGDETIDFIYGSEGIIGFKVGNSNYLYRKNLFGDVIEIYNDESALVGKYSYTAFGVCTVELDTNGIATKNPIRYRSYYYDDETELYYLKSRYYDPEVGRFITIDDLSYLDPESINGLNLYAYCLNNPVIYVDPYGNSIFLTMLLIGILAGAIIGGTLNGISAYNAGQRGWGLFGAIAGGVVMGGAMGAVLVLGGAAGLSAAIAPLGLSIAGFSLSTGAAFGISIAIGAGAGIISYAFENGLRTDRTFTLGGMFVSGLSGILKAVTTFGVAYGGGKAGAFDKLLLKPLMEGVKDSVTYGILKGVLNSILSGVGRDLIATSTWFLGESITKIIFVSSVASGLRWLIDKIFGT